MINTKAGIYVENSAAALRDLVAAHDLRLPAALQQDLPQASSRDRYAQACLQVRPLRNIGPMPAESYRIMGSYLASASTLHEVLARLGQFGELAGNAGAVTFDTQAARVTLDALRYVDVAPSSFETIFPTLYVAQLYHFLSWLTDCPLALAQLDLQTGQPSDTAIYQRIFATQTRFGCQQNVLHFARGELTRPQLRGEKEIATFFDDWHGLIIMAPLYAMHMAERVSRLLEHDFKTNSVNISVMAGALRIAPTTLRNRLRKEGTSLQKLKDECRMRLAGNYLLNTEMPLDKIASELGYSEASNFYQSFKRLFNTTPAEFRRTRNG